MNPVRVGEQIATQRKKLNMTQTQLAEMLHVSNKSVSRWENGTTMPDISLLIPLSEILQVSLNDLLGAEVEESVNEELLKDTVRMSADQVEKQKAVSNKMIVNLMVSGLIVFTLVPWCIDPKSSINLMRIDPPGFYVLLAEMAGYCILVNLLNQKDRTVNLISYIPLILNVYILIKDLLTVIQKTVSMEPRMTLMPVVSCVYACAMIVVHYIFLTESSLKTEIMESIRRINPENGNVLLFLISVTTIVFVTFVPAINYSGVSYRTLLESFVEREPEWIGNHQGKDYYNGVIMTYGYVSLSLCPILCLWAKLRNRIIFVLTNLCLVHVFASIINYPIRFKELPQSWLTSEYVFTCLLPITAILLLNFIYFRQTFMSAEKGKMNRTDQGILLLYLIIFIVLFSYVFLAVPFGPHLANNQGEWFLMMFMTVLAIVTCIHMVLVRKATPN
ncbi:MAG: helix-turn-helix transcriptional regulator [Oscillospiraceae bacterium]|nr:helix-turn-helix transcriptional regulator [Oscillospiraceae bacterium]